jgi:hypothetical protein
VLVPNLEITGDDAVFVWYYRSQFGEEAQALRRKCGAAWSWLLTLRGFTDEEIRIAMLSRAAGTDLGRLARMRGIDVRDRRIAEAFDLLGAAGEKLPWQDQRDPVLGGWATGQLPADLAEAEARMRAELGDRRARVQALLRIARAHPPRRPFARRAGDRRGDGRGPPRRRRHARPRAPRRGAAVARAVTGRRAAAGSPAPRARLRRRPRDDPVRS